MPILSLNLNIDDHPWDDLQTLKHQGKLITAMGPEAGAIRIGALPGGMKSGKTSIAIAVPLPDGTLLLTETSLELFLAAAAAFKAAYPNG